MFIKKVMKKKRRNAILKIPLGFSNLEMLQTITNIVFKAEKHGGELVTTEAPQLTDGNRYSITLLFTFKNRVRRQFFVFLLTNVYRYQDEYNLI